MRGIYEGERGGGIGGSEGEYEGERGEGGEGVSAMMCVIC